MAQVNTPPVATGPLLSIQHARISFGGLTAVADFSLDLPAGSLTGLIGPNGAGKTTIFNLVTGVYPLESGRMLLGPYELSGLKPHQIARAGICRTFQNIRVFGHLSVLQNVLVSYHMRCRYGLASALLRAPRFLRVESELVDSALDLVELMGLSAKRDLSARYLSYGEQRHLEIARALAAKPKVLLLDEPAAGLNTSEKIQLMETVASIRQLFGVTILLIEHDMKLVMGICERIVVLDHGETIADGPPKGIQSDPKVIEAYLGGT